MSQSQSETTRIPVHRETRSRLREEKSKHYGLSYDGYIRFLLEEIEE